MPRLLWWAYTLIGLSLASPFLVFAIWTFSDGEYLFGVVLLSIGLIGLFFPQYVHRRLSARKRAAFRTWLAKLPGVTDQAE